MIINHIYNFLFTSKTMQCLSPTRASSSLPLNLDELLCLRKELILRLLMKLNKNDFYYLNHQQKLRSALEEDYSSFSQQHTLPR